MLFDAAQTRLISVPEGMRGAAVLPDSLAAVPAYVFSRCTKLSAITFEGSTAQLHFSSENGILYNKDKTNLVAAPVSLGATATIAPECQIISEGAFVANTDLTTIVISGAVSEIATGETAHFPVFVGDISGEDIPSFGAFSQQTIDTAKIVINVGESATEGANKGAGQSASEDELALYKQAWQAAGFTNFASPVYPGQTIAPSNENAGFKFVLLDNFTLSVGWQEGSNNQQAPERIDMPTYGEIDGVRYSVTEIADEGFASQTSIKSVNIPESITRIGSNAFAKSGIQAISIPGSVTEIEAGAFSECDSLSALDLSEGLQIIGKSAFAGIAANTIILPATVKSVGDYAFANSPNLETILALGSIENISPTALSENTNVKVYVPYAKSEEYGWALGAPAAGNHLLAYGVDIQDAPVTLEEGQTVNLFDNGGYLKAPEGFEVNYSYKAKSLSVDSEGNVEAKQAGSSNVEVSISLSIVQNVPNTITSKEAKLTPASFASTDTAQVTYTLTRSASGSYVVEDSLPKYVTINYFDGEGENADSYTLLGSEEVALSQVDDNGVSYGIAQGPNVTETALGEITGWRSESPTGGWFDTLAIAEAFEGEPTHVTSDMDGINMYAVHPAGEPTAYANTLTINSPVQWGLSEFFDGAHHSSPVYGSKNGNTYTLSDVESFSVYCPDAMNCRLVINRSSGSPSFTLHVYAINTAYVMKFGGFQGDQNWALGDGGPYYGLSTLTIIPVGFDLSVNSPIDWTAREWYGVTNDTYYPLNANQAKTFSKKIAYYRVSGESKDKALVITYIDGSAVTLHCYSGKDPYRASCIPNYNVASDKLLTGESVTLSWTGYTFTVNSPIEWRARDWTDTKDVNTNLAANQAKTLTNVAWVLAVYDNYASFIRIIFADGTWENLHTYSGRQGAYDSSCLPKYNGIGTTNSIAQNVTISWTGKQLTVKSPIAWTTNMAKTWTHTSYAENGEHKVDNVAWCSIKYDGPVNSYLSITYATGDTERLYTYSGRSDKNCNQTCTPVYKNATSGNAFADGATTSVMDILIGWSGGVDLTINSPELAWSVSEYYADDGASSASHHYFAHKANEAHDTFSGIAYYVYHNSGVNDTYFDITFADATSKRCFVYSGDDTGGIRGTCSATAITSADVILSNDVWSASSGITLKWSGFDVSVSSPIDWTASRFYTDDGSDAPSHHAKYLNANESDVINNVAWYIYRYDGQDSRLNVLFADGSSFTYHFYSGQSEYQRGCTIDSVIQTSQNPNGPINANEYLANTSLVLEWSGFDLVVNSDREWISSRFYDELHHETNLAANQSDTLSNVAYYGITYEGVHSRIRVYCADGSAYTYHMWAYGYMPRCLIASDGTEISADKRWAKNSISIDWVLAEYTIVFKENTDTSKPQRTSGGFNQPQGSGTNNTLTINDSIDLSSVWNDFKYQGFTPKSNGTWSSLSVPTSNNDLKLDGIDGTVSVLDILKQFSPAQTSITLYAQWDEVKYDIKYDSIKGSAQGLPSKESQVLYTSNITLPSKDPTNFGYNFNGWQSSSSGNVEMLNESISVYELLAEDDFTSTTITLTAQWSPIAYTLVYNADSASNLKGSSAKPGISVSSNTFTIEDVRANGGAGNDNSKIKQPNLPYFGYDFDGFSGGIRDTKVSNLKESTQITEDIFKKLFCESDDAIQTQTNEVTLSASWTPWQYTITWNGNSGKTSDGQTSVSSVQDYDKQVVVPTFIRDGYTFAGYKTEDSPSGKLVSSSNVWEIVAAFDSATSATGAVPIEIFATWSEDADGGKYIVEFWYQDPQDGTFKRADADTLELSAPITSKPSIAQSDAYYTSDKYVNERRAKNDTFYVFDKDNANNNLTADSLTTNSSDTVLKAYYKLALQATLSAGAYGAFGTENLPSITLPSSGYYDWGECISQSELNQNNVLLNTNSGLHATDSNRLKWEAVGWPDDITSTKLDSDKTFSAQWQEIAYTLTYAKATTDNGSKILNFDSSSEDAQDSLDVVLTYQEVLDGASLKTAGDISVSYGFCFDGWYSDNSSSDAIAAASFNDVFKAAADEVASGGFVSADQRHATVYGKCRANVYTINFYRTLDTQENALLSAKVSLGTAADASNSITLIDDTYMNSTDELKALKMYGYSLGQWRDVDKNLIGLAGDTYTSNAPAGDTGSLQDFLVKLGGDEAKNQDATLNLFAGWTSVYRVCVPIDSSATRMTIDVIKPNEAVSDKEISVYNYSPAALKLSAKSAWATKNTDSSVDSAKFGEDLANTLFGASNLGGVNFTFNGIDIPLVGSDSVVVSDAIDGLSPKDGSDYLYMSGLKGNIGLHVEDSVIESVISNLVSANEGRLEDNKKVWGSLSNIVWTLDLSGDYTQNDVYMFDNANSSATRLDSTYSTNRP